MICETTVAVAVEMSRGNGADAEIQQEYFQYKNDPGYRAVEHSGDTTCRFFFFAAC